MAGLFDLSAPWWSFILRAVAIYLMVVVLMRVSGKRAMGQFTPFDMVLLILIGNAVQNGLNGGDNSLTGAALMAGTLIVLNYAVAWATSRNRAIEILVEGVPVVLARNGQVFRDVLRRELVSRSDFEEALRGNGVRHLDDVGLALLETDGSISVLPRETVEGSTRAPPGTGGGSG